MAVGDASGSHVLAIHHRTVSWAVSEVVRVLGPDGSAKLKVGSGEHLAAILTTAFLGTPPTQVDTDGGPDLEFDLTGRTLEPALIGRPSAPFADFEVKSLPGGFRRFDSALNKAIAAGGTPSATAFKARVTTANDLVQDVGMSMVARAGSQLVAKSTMDRSRNVFLIAHFFDHPIVEMFDAPLLAHHLEPLELPDGVDNVWMLFAPHSLVVWSSTEGRWTNVIFSGIGPEEPSRRRRRRQS